jgi:thioesterase domain-containing protein
LFVEIEAQFGIRLPMTTLLDAPTVVDLASRIAAASRGEARQSLRLLKPGVEGGPALFLVHDGDGEVLLYLNLARRLPEEVAVYGIEPQGTDRCPTILTTIPEMARAYVSTVRKACPTGPYFLGGLCAGGTIAFEMAMQLQAAGESVGLVALLDSADARAELKPNLMIARRWDHFVHSLREEPTAVSNGEPAATGNTSTRIPPFWQRAQVGSWLGRLSRKARKVAIKVRNVTAYEVESWLKDQADASRIGRLQNMVADQGEPARNFVGPSFRTVYHHAERHFEPSGRLDAPVLLVRAGGDGRDYPGDEPIERIYREPLLGWASRVVDGPETIEVLDISGGHGGMLQEPHVASIVGPLWRAIEQSSVAEVGR